MGYCIRYIFTDEAAPDLEHIALQVSGANVDYEVTMAQDGIEISQDGAMIGFATLNAIDDPCNDPSLEALLAELDALEEADAGAETDAVSARLWNATGLLTVQVLWEEAGEPGDSLKALSPIWGALLGKYPGVLQADREGYYDGDGLLLDLV